MNIAESARPLVLVSSVVAVLWACDATAQTVKVTPLGSHTGELCQNDRALLFEDPTGVRILYDVGTAVAGGGDPRLGEVHVVLLSHAHGDHIGDQKAAGINAGTCGRPETVSAAPNSNTVEIAAAKNAALIVSNTHVGFLAPKIQSIRGAPTPNCPADGLSREMTVPRSAPCVGNLQLGGSEPSSVPARRRRCRSRSYGPITATRQDPICSQVRKCRPGRGRSDCLRRSRERLRAHLHQWPSRVLVWRYGHLRRHENHHQGLLSSQSGSDEHGRVCDAGRGGGVRGRRTDPACRRHPLARQRSRDRGRRRTGGDQDEAIHRAHQEESSLCSRSGHTMEFSGDAKCVTGC